MTFNDLYHYVESYKDISDNNYAETVKCINYLLQHDINSFLCLA